MVLKKDGNHKYAKTMIDVNDDIYKERERQNKLYGQQQHNNGHWLMILIEEVGEVAQAMQQGGQASKETDADDLYKELIHVAAVASAMAEQVKREND
jgi:NTP pyrophosphatase (non-canonical NTP hydrolase)